ncbi:MAG: TonB-dependent receptor [Bacteroidota bacterium]|nr:TonB-dependent receptor [Bacteroidota bacterium]
MTLNKLKDSSIIILASILLVLPTYGQSEKTDANIFGDVQSKGEHLPFATIHIKGTAIGTATDKTGHYMMVNLPIGEHILIAQMVGFKSAEKTISIRQGLTIEVNFELEQELMGIDAIVVTGTKTFKRKTESPIIVNVLEGKLFEKIDANTLLDGLAFMPGLRVETDCQTCNYSQLRMNGLGGSYSQILVNGRPVFSSLTGLYGLEQIPSNMIQQIEVVRGGGSALYGSSAIGGTVNVITRIPKENSFEVSSRNSWINGSAQDQMVNGSLSVLSQKRNAGISLYTSYRNRDEYDHNGDGFSEMPLLSNNSFGLNAFLKPAPNQKLELNFSSLYEFRRGGDQMLVPAHQAEQSEERTHNILMGGLDYEVNFNDHNSQFILYSSGQRTIRRHYTGIIPDLIEKPYMDSTNLINHFLNPPYGTSKNTTYQIGTQINHKVDDLIIGINTLTIGAEYVYDDIFDEIQAYHYKLDQTTSNLGAFFQSDWAVSPSFTLLAGVRADKHNLLENIVINPRASLLYRLKTHTQFRLSWAKGFRAPQAFDSDMHIAFAGGGVSRVVLSPYLHEERSQSLSGSVNYDMPKEKYVYGFTLEGFYTKLDDAFVMEEAGQDEFGMIFEKRNAGFSTVQGITMEARANYNRLYQLEAGVTLQSSTYDKPIIYSGDLDANERFLKTPDQYGYFTLIATPNSRFNGSISGVYTGPMLLIHYAGSPELPEEDVYVQTEEFFELNTKLAYKWTMNRVDTELEIFGGIQNILNTYQKDFDTGKYRDSNYIYGPGKPRTFYLGIKIKSL